MFARSPAGCVRDIESMNLAALAKLGTRLPVAYVAFVVVPGRVFMMVRTFASIAQGTTETSDGGRSLAMPLVFFACVFVVLFVLWFQADRLVPMFLPAGASRQPEGYAVAQRLGLSVIGLVLLFNALKGFQLLVFGTGFAIGGDPNTMLFNFVVGLVLLVGWDAITARFPGRKPKRFSHPD